MRCAVDARHNLIVHCEATNSNDAQALYNASMHAKENMELKQPDNIDVLADKGYHNGRQLHNCALQNIHTYAAYREQPAVKHLDKEFLVAQFAYDKQTDTYTCPAGEQLTSTGTWHNKKRETGETSYRFKKYTTLQCAHCKLRTQCTKLQQRAIERSEYQDAVDANNGRINENKAYYRTRQSICEHPFGTVKRAWGYTYTLLKGLKKVDGEISLIMLCYNIKRTLNIAGFERLLEGINKWAPDYKRVLCSLKMRIYKRIAALSKPMKFLTAWKHSLLQIPVMSS